MMAASPSTPPTLQEQISLAVPENNALRQTLRETDYAPSSIRQRYSQISILLKQIREKKPNVSNLDLQRKKQQALNQNYRDSKMRRFTYNIAGKKEIFAHKMADAEKEFLETSGKHAEAAREVEALEAELAEAWATLGKLEEVDKKRADALDKLEKLFDSIFEGPTPEFPEEDRVELAVVEAREKFEKAQQKLMKEQKVLKILKEAGSALCEANGQMRKARDASEMGMAGTTGGEYMDQEEQNALWIARRHVDEMEVLMRQAREISPEIDNLGRMDIPKAHSRSNPWNHDHYEENENLRDIKSAGKRVAAAVEKMELEKWAAERKVGWEKIQTKKAEESFEEERKRLRDLRQGIFNQVTGGLPEYKP